jgi:hypothetical protein
LMFKDGWGTPSLYVPQSPDIQLWFEVAPAVVLVGSLLRVRNAMRQRPRPS